VNCLLPPPPPPIAEAPANERSIDSIGPSSARGAGDETLGATMPHLAGPRVNRRVDEEWASRVGTPEDRVAGERSAGRPPPPE